MAVEWTIHRIEHLPRLGKQWDDLNAHCGNMPFLDCAIFEYACRYFGAGDEMLATCHDNQRLVAAAILQRTAFGTWQTFQPGQIPMGAFVCRSDYKLETLVTSAMRALPGFCLLFGITQLDPAIFARPENSSTIETIDYIETARITIKSTFQDYWQARGSNLRQNLKKQRNRLAREGVQIRLECVQDVSSIADAIDDYGRLESLGWKGQEGTSLHPDNAQGRFYRDMFRYCAAKREASVYRYFFGDRLVASDLCVHRDGVIIVLKTAFDASEKSLSPSLLMKEQAYEQLFANGTTRRIEFYGRVMEWHRRWSDEIRTMYHINKFRWSWLRKLRSARSHASGEPALSADDKSA